VSDTETGRFSVQDYYDLAFEASRSIARVKVIPGLDDTLTPVPGHITVVIAPYSEEDKPLVSAVLKKQVKDYIRERAGNLVTVHVIDPAYIKVNLHVELTTDRMDSIPVVSSEAMGRIKEFLHPIRGGEEGRGWDFGRAPCLSDLYALLHQIEGVLYIESIRMVLEADGRTYTIYGDTTGYRLPGYSLIYPGDVDIKVNLESEATV